MAKAPTPTPLLVCPNCDAPRGEPILPTPADEPIADVHPMRDVCRWCRRPKAPATVR